MADRSPPRKAIEQAQEQALAALTALPPSSNKEAATWRRMQGAVDALGQPSTPPAARADAAHLIREVLDALGDETRSPAEIAAIRRLEGAAVALEVLSEET